MSERIKLIVTEAKEPQKVGTKGAEKLSFKGKSPDGKELWYFSFKTSLFPAILKDATLDAEVETKSREVDGNTYIDRQVQQLYDAAGQPIGAVKKDFQPGGYTRRDNPEERASIESQTAAKIAGELLVGKVISVTDTLGKALIDWCAARLMGGNAPEAPKQAMKPPASSPTITQGETGAASATAGANLEVSGDAAWDELVGKGHEHIPQAAQKPSWPLIAKYCKALGFPAAHLPKALGLPGDDVNQWKGSHEAALDKLEAYARKNCQYVGPKWQEIKLV